MTELRDQLRSIRTFPSLVRFLRDELDWPVETEDFEELTFDYSAEELGIDAANAAKIEEIKKLRPLQANQPWGIFFVKFEPKRLPVIALRRILAGLVLKKREKASAAEQPKWAEDDLLFISNYGEGDERQITFAHFSQPEGKGDLATLKVLGWDNLDTPLHLDDVAETLTHNLAWPEDDDDFEEWRAKWSAAFTLGYRESITTARQLSLRLAELARAIRDRITTALAIETQEGPLTKLMTSFQEALVHDLDAEGFADMYAQTIAYGLLSARIADPHRRTADDFAGHMRTNPFLRELMETFLKVGGRRGGAGEQGIDFDELGVTDVVLLLDNAKMEAVVRDFGDRNPQEDPVIHFYELFLKEYDARKRMQRGVFYTPRPVVSYIVRSVDELLRTEFGLEDGLADTTTWGEMATRHDLKLPEGVSVNQAFVQILDPATGTGTFLVEVVDVVHSTLVTKWKAQGHSDQDIADLWNDYVPKHLLPRLHGYEILMAPYAIAHLKIGLKLYETGYRFDSNERARIYLTNALEPAYDYSDTEIASVIPALAHEARAVAEVKDQARFAVLIGNPPYAKNSANRSQDAEALVAPYKLRVYGETNVQPLSDDYVKFMAFFANHAGVPSVVGVITNRSYLSGLIHRGMREQLLEQFSHVMITDLHGDSNVGERVPSGEHNENVFEITQGVAISVFVREPEAASGESPHATVDYRETWGRRADKYAFLESQEVGSQPWNRLDPVPEYWFWVPGELVRDEGWLGIDELFYVSGMGLKSRRDHFLIAKTAGELEARMQRLVDATDLDQVRQEFGVKDNAQWTLAKMRDLVVREGVRERIFELQYRPFDRRFIWYHPEAIERGDARWPVMRNVIDGSLSLLTSRQSVNDGFTSAFVAGGLSEMKTAESSRGSYVFPLMSDGKGKLRGAIAGLEPNFSRERLGHYLAAASPIEVLEYIYAILHSRGYRERYSELLRIEFPKIPPDPPKPLAEGLCELGRRLIQTHLLAEPVSMAAPRTYVGDAEPVVETVIYSDGAIWITKGRTAGFADVPEDVWQFEIGGYRVCEKWLKARRGDVLGAEEITHVENVTFALSETIRLMTEIDEVIEERGGWPDAFAASDVPTCL